MIVFKQVEATDDGGQGCCSPRAAASVAFTKIDTIPQEMRESGAEPGLVNYPKVRAANFLIFL